MEPTAKGKKKVEFGPCKPKEGEVILKRVGCANRPSGADQAGGLVVKRAIGSGQVEGK